MTKELKLHFGALAKPIASQLADQGLKFTGSRIAVIQEHEKQIISLWFAGIISDKEKEKAHERLFMMVKKHIQSHLKPVKA